MILRQTNSPTPGIGEINLVKRRKTALKGFTVVSDKVLQMVLARTTIWVEAEAVAYQYAVIYRPAYGAAKRMRGDNAPDRFAAQPGLLIGGQRAGQATVQEGRQQASAQEAKVRRKCVVRQNQLICRDAAFVMHQRHFVAIINSRDRRILVKCHVRWQIVRQPFHQRRRLQQDGAGNIKRLFVVTGADVVR